MTKNTWKFTLVIFIVAGGLAAMLLSVVRSIANQESTNPLQDPSSYELMSLQSVLPQAIELANDWRDDAYLFWGTFSVYPETSQFSSTVVLRFEAKNAPVWYIISFWEIDGERKVEVKEEQYDERVNFPPRSMLGIESILMDSIQAFEFLHGNGGSDFISKYGDQEFYVTLFLEAKSSTTAHWRVLYHLEPGPAWNIKMNAYTNELLKPDIYGEE